MSRGIELVSDSEAIVVAEVAERSPVSSEAGGEGGNRLAGCWTLATMIAGEFRSNCCTVLLAPRVNKVARGP
jgi:hypothetical protein